MAAVTIRKLPDEVHATLKRRATAKGQSTEAEIRETLIAATQQGTEPRGLGSALHELWKQHGSVKLKLPFREATGRLVDIFDQEAEPYDP